MTLGGFFDLDTPKDLFQKLLHDYHRIVAAPGDRYAAMDFIIVANHLRDWVERHENRRIASCPLLEICRQLANNAKHFISRQKEVKDTKVAGGAFQFGAFQSSAFDVGHLSIGLAGDAEQEFGDEIRIEVLASKVVAFWQEKLGPKLL
jgi:hypothetical protein